MTDEQIHSVLEQIEAGKENRRQTYCCCDMVFSSLYDFRRHLFLEHPRELEEYFEPALHRESPAKPTKEEIHRMANKGRKKIERTQTKIEEKKRRERNLNAYPNPAKGDYFRLIYTPMGNKK